MSRLFASILALCSLTYAQRQFGEIRLHVTDPTGAAVIASGELTGHGTDVRRRVQVQVDGRAAITSLPFGLYHLRLTHAGFQPFERVMEIRSEIPVSVEAALGVAPVETTLQISVADTLLNPDRTGATQQLGAAALRDRKTTIPAREILSLVDAEPGWLLEANGVLHPRGSEYGVQYVVNGMPMLENRSPVFAPLLDIEEFQSIAIRTGGYPAEYGHQLGGVIEVTTRRDDRPGLHGRVLSEGGSFGTMRTAANVQFARKRNIFAIAGNATRTDRYLDPPTEQNWSNHGFGGGFSGWWDRDWSGTQRTRASVRQSRTGFLVPNETLQQSAGQRQDRRAGETAGQLSYSDVLSPRVLLEIRGSVRDVSADLWSNSLSTPIAPWQQRGFREGYTIGSVSVHHGIHDLKAGGELLFRSVHESFGYQITAYRLNGVRIFDRDTPQTFAFADRAQNREQGMYVQDHIRLGSVTVDAGIRWDRYRFVESQNAFSPRVAAAWQTGGANGLILRASYDRAFQTPAIENLLLSSSSSVLALGDQGISLPVRPATADFYEAGFTKALFGRVRLDASYFRRDFTNYPDDDLLLNTGVSFPIAFASASIHGTEVKIDVPKWGRFSGYLSYTNMTGRGRLPIAGGLFLEDGADELLNSNAVFAITQDQRNTARAQVRAQATSRVWLAVGALYGSGLPVELDEDANIASLRQQFGSAVADRVNFSRGRVRPSFSADVSGGADLWQHEHKAVRAQFSVLNITDRLNVINFASLFSGTAIAPGRWAAGRLMFEF